MMNSTRTSLFAMLAECTGETSALLLRGWER